MKPHELSLTGNKQATPQYLIMWYSEEPGAGLFACSWSHAVICHEACWTLSCCRRVKSRLCELEVFLIHRIFHFYRYCISRSLCYNWLDAFLSLSDLISLVDKMSNIFASSPLWWIVLHELHSSPAFTCMSICMCTFVLSVCVRYCAQSRGKSLSPRHGEKTGASVWMRCTPAALHQCWKKWINTIYTDVFWKGMRVCM